MSNNVWRSEPPTRLPLLLLREQRLGEPLQEAGPACQQKICLAPPLIAGRCRASQPEGIAIRSRGSLLA